MPIVYILKLKYCSELWQIGDRIFQKVRMMLWLKMSIHLPTYAK